MMTQNENQGLHKNKMIVNLQVEVQRKLKYLKKHQKVILVEALLVLLVIQRHNFFQYNSTSQFKQLLPLAIWSQCKKWNPR